ncbi:hypothetical protein [Streptomyces chartreusis]|uniref:GNAT family N-acetyltransferase n=1 Tax=Streptomyces chartreusis TaxID=1969 RepID=A0A7H8TP45_STRCX|nr:hypothetical protein [Streptomyces chartreusis]QKZ23890.1 hypothetical protein HUT05_44980 [Streptomyces chartreusis]
MKPIDAMIKARELWLRNRGHHSYGQGTAVLGLLGQPAANARVVCLVDKEDRHIFGCNVLLTTTPASTDWTAAERREHSWGMTMSHTHPAFLRDRIGWLITIWVADYAARQPDPPQWVRCRVPHPRLMAHYRDELGWQLVRTVLDRDRRGVALMQRRPESISAVSALIASSMPLEVS